MNDETIECVRYLDYKDTLGQLSRDYTVPAYYRWTAGFLTEKIEYYHYYKCVKPYIGKGLFDK